jgi:scyllo-inositol 2-dehydrogenase (NADP+)
LGDGGILAAVANLRVAIVGYGLAGRVFHGPLIAATPGLEVATVVTGSPDRAAQAGRDHPGLRVLARAEEMWVGEPPELVVVAAPNDVHASLAAEAIDRGVPVVVDKPLAVSVAEAEALLARAQSAGVMLSVFHNRRWDSDQLTLRRMMAEDALGDVVRYESRFERWRPEPASGSWRESTSPEAGGGQLLDLGPHLIDQALVLFGPVTHVYAEIEAQRGLSSDDDAFLALRHASGTISHLHASSVTPSPGPRLRVQGTRAAFLVNGLDSQEDALSSGLRPDETPDWGRVKDWERGRLVTGEQSVPVPSEPGAWQRFYSLLEEALRTGGPPPVDPLDAVAGLRVIEAARRSAETHSVIALSEVSERFGADPR